MHSARSIPLASSCFHPPPPYPDKPRQKIHRLRSARVKASTAECATSFSTRACFSVSTMPAPGSRAGSPITTSSVHTPHSVISHRPATPPISPQHAIVCATLTSSADRVLRSDNQDENAEWPANQDEKSAVGVTQGGRSPTEVRSTACGAFGPV